MSISEVQICNSALAKIGAQGIVALSDATPAAFLCNQLFHALRKEVLRSHPWKFATARSVLAASGTAPAWGYAYAFPLPGDCLRPIDIEENESEWKVESHLGVEAIVTDNATCKVKYIRDVLDVSRFDANFSEALAFRLAMDLAIPLTSSNSLSDDMAQKFKMTVATARSFDAQQGTPQQVQANDWLNSRY